MKKNISIVFALLIIASMALAACQPQVEEVVKTVVVTEVVEVEGETVVQTQVVEVVVTPEPEPEMEEPVTLLWNWGTEPPTMDPALTSDTTSVDGTENMFVGLTVLTAEGDVEPYLATDWEVGEDADGNQTYTFNLRDDIPWVKYDPVTGETTQEVDEEGNPRFVNAHDVVYGVEGNFRQPVHDLENIIGMPVENYIGMPARLQLKNRISIRILLTKNPLELILAKQAQVTLLHLVLAL